MTTWCDTMGVIIGNMAHRPGFGSSNGKRLDLVKYFLVQHNLHICGIFTFFLAFHPVSFSISVRLSSLPVSCESDPPSDRRIRHLAAVIRDGMRHLEFMSRRWKTTVIALIVPTYFIVAFDCFSMDTNTCTLRMLSCFIPCTCECQEPDLLFNAAQFGKPSSESKYNP